MFSNIFSIIFLLFKILYSISKKFLQLWKNIQKSSQWLTVQPIALFEVSSTLFHKSFIQVFYSVYNIWFCKELEKLCTLIKLFRSVLCRQKKIIIKRLFIIEIKKSKVSPGSISCYFFSETSLYQTLSALFSRGFVRRAANKIILQFVLTNH